MFSPKLIHYVKCQAPDVFPELSRMKRQGAWRRHAPQAPSALTGLVQRMEAAGWIERRPCDRDTRSQRAWLLDAGRAALPPLRRATRRIQHDLADGFTDTELQTVARWLRHVRQLGDQPEE